MIATLIARQSLDDRARRAHASPCHRARRALHRPVMCCRVRVDDDDEMGEEDWVRKGVSSGGRTGRADGGDQDVDYMS